MITIGDLWRLSKSMIISSDVNLETDGFVKLGWKGYQGNLFQEIRETSRVNMKAKFGDIRLNIFNSFIAVEKVPFIWQFDRESS